MMTWGVGGIIGLVLVRQTMALNENSSLYLETKKEIDERVKVEESLQDSKRRLTDIINFLPDATFVIDQKGRVIAWNKAMEEMTGVHKEDIIGRGEYAYGVPFYEKPRPMLVDIIDKHDEEIESKYIRIKRKERTIYAEAYVPSLFNRRGAYVWATASLLYDDNCNQIGAIESIRDITLHKKAEERLAKLNECFLNFSTNAEQNIDRLVTLCGEQLEATCALYNRLQDGKLCSVGQWNTPSDFISGRYSRWAHLLRLDSKLRKGSQIDSRPSSYDLFKDGSKCPSLQS